jgi:2,4-dienoyl-CoA reductase-like NADH-dependent reductase (Old Yellow Enzyme family)
MGNIPVDARYPEAMKNATIDRDAPWAADHVSAFKPVIAAAKAHGSVVIAQLTHGGRQSSVLTTEQPVSS